MNKIKVDYNYEGGLESAYDKQFPIYLGRNSVDESMELTVSEAEHVVVELVKLIKEVKSKRIEKIMDDVIKEFG